MTEKKKPQAYAHWGRMLLSLLMAVMMLAGLVPSAAFAAEAEPQPPEQQQLVTPETPAEPETSAEPETPETPDEPEIPEAPETPETPDAPEVSDKETLTAEMVETAALTAAAPKAVKGTDYNEFSSDGCYVYTWRGLQYALYEERFAVVRLESDIDTSSLNNGYGLQKLEGVVDDTICARGSKTLNLNSHKINIVFGKSVYQPIRVIASADLTIQSGTITATKRESGGCALIYSAGALHLKWVDITLTIDNIADNAYSAVMLESLVTHDSTISNCNIRVKVNEDLAKNVRPDYLPYAIKVFGEDRLTINDGNYDRVIVYGVPNEKNTGEHHSLLVKDGTFYSFTLFMMGELNGNIQPENPIRIKAAQFRNFSASDTGYGSDNRRLRLYSHDQFYTVKNFNQSKTLPNGRVERLYNKDGIKLADYIKKLYYTFLEPNSLLMFDGEWSDGQYSGTGYLPGIENEKLNFLYYPQMSLKADKAQIFSECYGVKDVQLNGKSIDYAENYYGSVINCNINEQLSYQYYELPAQAKRDGYSYKLSYDVYKNGGITTDNRSIDSGSNPWSIWMPSDACSYWVNFKLNLAKGDDIVGPMINSHIVKLNVRKLESTEKAISQIYLRQPGGDLFTGMVTATDSIEVEDTAAYTVTSPGSWTTSDKKTYTRKVTLTAKTGYRFPTFSAISSIPVTVLDSDTVGRVTNVAADGKTTTVTLTAELKERLTHIRGTLSGFLDGAPASGVTIRSNEPEKYMLYISAIQKVESGSYTDGSGKLDWGVSYSIVVRVEPRGNYGYRKDNVMLLIARAEGGYRKYFRTSSNTLCYDSEKNGLRTLNIDSEYDLRPYYANIEVALPVAGKDTRIQVLNPDALGEKFITVDTAEQKWCDAKEWTPASTIVAGKEYGIKNLPIALTGGAHSAEDLFNEKWIGVTINGMGASYDEENNCLNTSDYSLFTAVTGDGSALWGDLNDDGSRNVLDIQVFYSYLTSGAAPIGFSLSRCDLNSDGKRDVYDLQLLYEVVSGIRGDPTA